MSDTNTEATSAGTGAKAAGTLVLAGAALLAGLQSLEKQELIVYADKLANGLPTYCSGTTLPTRPVGQRIPKAECDAIDRATAEEYGRAVLACIPSTRMDQNSFDAFTLFAINVGKGGACKSRAAQFMRAGERDLACYAMATGPDGKPAWSFAGGRYIQGLQNRRLFEREWCLRRADTPTSTAVVISAPAPKLVDILTPLPQEATATVSGGPEAKVPLPWWRTIFSRKPHD